MSLFELIPFRSQRTARRQDGTADEERFVVPVYEFKQAGDAYGLEIFVPGVAKDAVEIEVDQGELVVTARRRWKTPDGWTELFRETTAEANYRLRVDLNDSVDVEKINAELENGVLRLTLPKAEAFKPRKIDVS